MTKQRISKLKLIKEFTTAIMNRKSRFDDSADCICWDAKTKKAALRDVKKYDKQIDEIMANWKDAFPSLSKFDDCEIAVMLFIFASIFSNDVPSVDSRDLFSIILRESESDLDVIMVSLSDNKGHLHQWIEKTESRSARNAYGLRIRSLEIYENFILGK